MRGKALLAVVGVLHLTCQSILTAPVDSTITVIANPLFVEAHGGVSVVSAVVTEAIGTPVADGTVVQFFTTLGRIEEQGRTNDGVARVNFVSDSRSGVAQVTAISGPAVSEAVEIQVGSVRPARVIVTASPNRLTDSRTAQVLAIVLDEFGNPVPNVPVFFAVLSGVVAPPSPSPAPGGGTTAATEFMESQGQPVFTDNDGRARDVMRTRYDRSLPSRTVTVTATTANGVTDTTQVVIN
ncbi:MAG TPA: hypothetical protein VIG50_21095 [Vicinamibacteria bacterium]